MAGPDPAVPRPPLSPLRFPNPRSAAHGSAIRRMCGDDPPHLARRSARSGIALWMTPQPPCELSTLHGVSDVPNDAQPFLASDLPRLGLSRDRLRALLREHRVRRCLHRVYVSTDVPDSRELRIAALRRVIPSYGVLYGCTAAWVHAVDTFAPSKRFDLVPQCVVPHGMGRCKTAGVKCVEGYLPTAEVTEIGGLRATTPVRTTTDLLRTLRRPYALAAADGMAHAGLIKVGEVTAHLTRLKGFPASCRPENWPR